jgi:hypothetical protein
LTKDLGEGVKSNNRILQKQLINDDTSTWVGIDILIRRIGVYLRYKANLAAHRHFYAVLFTYPELDCKELESASGFTVNLKMLKSIRKLSDMKDTIQDIIKKVRGK